jgi:hypothetical protein
MSRTHQPGQTAFTSILPEAGVFYIGLGDQFDADKVKAYPPGSVIVLPGDTSHFCPPSALMRQIGWVEEGRISGSS